MRKKLVSLSTVSQSNALSLIKNLEIFYRNSCQGRISVENFENLSALTDHLLHHENPPQAITLDLSGFSNEDLTQTLIVVRLLLPLSKDRSLERYMQENGIISGHLTKFTDKITCKNDLFEFLKSFCVDNIRVDVRKKYLQKIKGTYSFRSTQAAAVLQKLEYILATEQQCSLEKIFEDCIKNSECIFIAMDYLKKRRIKFKRLSYCQDVDDQQWQQRKIDFLKDVEEKDCLVRIQGQKAVDFVTPTAAEIRQADNYRQSVKLQKEKELAEKQEIIQKCCQQNNLKYRQEYRYYHNLIVKDVDDRQWLAEKSKFETSCHALDTQGIIVRVHSAELIDYFESIIPGRDQQNEAEFKQFSEKLAGLINVNNHSN